MSFYIESPFERIVDVHWKKKDDEEEPPDEAFVCGSYELSLPDGLNGTLTIKDADGTRMWLVPDTSGYETNFYLENDPPGWTLHDHKNHSFDADGFILGASGIEWNMPFQPPNAFNVRMQGAVAFLITVDRVATFADMGAPPPPEGAAYEHKPIFVEYPEYQINGFGYGNMSYAKGPYAMPPSPDAITLEAGSESLLSRVFQINYLYQVLPSSPGSGPHDITQGGAGAFFFMFVATGAPTAIPDSQYPDILPGVVWFPNVYTQTGATNTVRITGFCKQPGELPHTHTEKVDLNKIRRGLSIDEARLDG